MLQARRPTDSDRHLALQRADDAAHHHLPAGRKAVREETIGWGLKRFDRARVALMRFEQFNLPATSIAPATVASEGLRIVVFARRLGLWTAAPMEVTALDVGDRSVGYTLRTLDGHPLAGEETFTVVRLDNGIVRFRIEATSRPSSGWARLILPVIRLVQRRFRRLAVQHMRNATGVARSSVAL